MARPIRLQLSRAAGFDLQKISRAFNGLDAVVVASPTKWGNPFSVKPQQPAGKSFSSGQYVCVPTVEDAVECFRLMLNEDGPRAAGMRAELHELRGKNLACWCRIKSPCHADVLLELANKEPEDGR